MKKLLENASLNAKMLFALLLALLLAAGVFFAAYGVGNYFIDKVYMTGPIPPPSRAGPPSAKT